jgi:deoxyribonuclease V
VRRIGFVAREDAICYEQVVSDSDLHQLIDVDLADELARLLTQIPRGRVTTYGALAEALGDRVAARWVGETLVDHPHGPDCPCHRVVRKNGEPGLYIAGNASAKLDQLRSEGVTIEAGRVALNDTFTTFTSTAPLRRLHHFQTGVPQQLTLKKYRGPIDRVAALDVAYVTPRAAVVACIVADACSRDVIASHTHIAPVTFPYISGYLAFRELPAMLRLWRDLTAGGPIADVVLIDGNGILHPRRAGIAACFGLLADAPTIGIGKSLLYGRVDVEELRAGETRPVIDRDELIGLAVKSTDRSRPIFVSPGNHCDVEQAAAIVQTLFAGHRLPEPLHRADRLTKQAARELRPS